MPTYEYQCTSCGHRFEELQSFSDRPLKKCPRCAGPVERLVSGGAGFIFKGAGFYATDYRSKEYKQQAQSESAPQASETVAPSSPQPAGEKK